MAEPFPVAPRFTLRQLPLPAKLVLTVFLLAVGLGYSSAMIQLHMQHSDRDGTPMPTIANVIAVFAGKKKPSESKTDECCRLEALIRGAREGGMTSKNMAPAFFVEDGAEIENDPSLLPKLADQREGERNVIIAWIRSADESRRQAFMTNTFKLPKDLVGKPLTQGYLKPPDQVLVRSILMDRCVRCHKPGGDKSDVPLTTYEDYIKFLPREAEVKYGWVDSGKQMSLEKLTQSTHAHLLSFAMLFALTGFIFAFTSYPTWVRVILAPIVLIAQVADVSCWWLARIEAPYGPLFAMCILGTGAVVGMGLITQIVFSLFNIYSPKGKVVLLLLALAALALGGWAATKVILPFLEDEKNRQRGAATIEEGNKEKPAVPVAKGIEPAKADGPLLVVLDGKHPDVKWGKAKGGMVPALFEKSGSDFRNAIKDGDEAEKKKILAERQGEHAFLVAWLKLPNEARKAAYDADKLTPPADLTAQPVTADYKADGAIKIKTILNDRCVKCHEPGADKEEIPLDTFEGILKQLQPKATDK